MALTKVTLGGAVPTPQLQLADMPAGVYSTAHKVALSASGTPDVAMPLIDNYESDGRYFGSTTATLTKDYTFSGITVPLIGANVQAGMVLKVIVAKQVANVWTLAASVEATLTAGQTSKYFELPVSMKQGERWAVLPGLKSGDFNAADTVFYERSGAVAPEPFAFYWIYTNNDPADTVGASISLSEGFSLVYQRAFTLHGANVPKGIEGKLAPADYIRAGDSSLRGETPVQGELFYDTTLGKMIVWDGGAWSVAPFRGFSQLERSFQAAGTLRVGFSAACSLGAATVFHNGTTAPTITYAKSFGMGGAQTAWNGVTPLSIASGEVLHISLSNMQDATDVSVAFNLS